MRCKEELLKAESDSFDENLPVDWFVSNGYLLLEVLIDIRDQLAEANYYLKPKIIKVK